MIEKLRLKVKLPSKVKPHIVNTIGLVTTKPRDHSHSYKDLLRAVQTRQIYLDGKTFVDLVPRKNLAEINKEFLLERNNPNFDLREFTNQNFYDMTGASSSLESYGATSISDYIDKTWTILGRKSHSTKGSLLALPYPFVVPGGRFQEQFYWDSYFIMLGLKEVGNWEMIENMIKNYTYMIRKFGYIPTANRSYFLTRSQPPYFSHMVELLASHRGQTTYIKLLPYLLSEYRFWMSGKGQLTKSAKFQAYRRIAKMPGGEILNRYFDDSATPRPESYREDTEAASKNYSLPEDEVYIHLRAAAESGWDFSSRWLSDPQDLSTIRTTEIVPVDLNCLLHHLEATIAKSYKILKNPLMHKKFTKLAEKRAAAINKYFWNDDSGFYHDFDLKNSKQTSCQTLAASYPLYTKIASKDQAVKVADILEKNFLKPGGLVTTLIENDQQWDSPNGWAPLQWTAIVGLRNYEINTLADSIKTNWLKVNQTVFDDRQKLVEKYDVIHLSKTGGGGGEYPLQDGFGWTNGVAAALLSEDSQ